MLESALGFPQTDTNLVAPDGSPKLIILCENSLESIVEGQSSVSPEGLYLVGNRDVPVLKRSNPRPIRMIGIEFYPHGGFPVLGMPMLEVSNHVLDAETAFGLWGRQVWDTFRDLPDVTEKIRFIQVQLIGLLERNHRRDNRLIDLCEELGTKRWPNDDQGVGTANRIYAPVSGITVQPARRFVPESVGRDLAFSSSSTHSGGSSHEHPPVSALASAERRFTWSPSTVMA
jgi:hypothetical protein